MNRIITYLVSLILSSSRSGDTVSDYAHSFSATIKLSLFLAPAVYLVDKLSDWGVANQDYILIVMGAILIDWVFGTIKHIWVTKTPEGRPTFTPKGNAMGLVMKIGLSVGGGFLFEGLSHLTAEADFIVTSLKIITRVVVFMYPAVSAWENIYIVSGEKFPPKKWMDKLGLFQSSLDIRDLTNDNKEENNNKE